MRVNRTLLAVVHDGVMAAASFYLSLYLRVGPQIDQYSTADILQNMGLLVASTLIFLRITGLYRGVWRYASLEDLFAIGRAATFAILVYTAALFILVRLEGQPRSTLVINWFVLIGLLSGPRILYRLSSRTAGSIRMFRARRVTAPRAGAAGRCRRRGGTVRQRDAPRPADRTTIRSASSGPEQQPRRPLDPPRAGAGHESTDLTEKWCAEAEPRSQTGGRSA